MTNQSTTLIPTQFCILYTFQVAIPISFLNTYEGKGCSTLNLFGLNMNRTIVNLSCTFITNFYIQYIENSLGFTK